jgi:site-specific DNA recombinase
VAFSGLFYCLAFLYPQFLFLNEMFLQVQGDEIDELRDKRQLLLVEDASLSGENERINELIEFIRKNKFRTLEYDDKLVRKIIQNVTVYDDRFIIAFKSGIEMEI